VTVASKGLATTKSEIQMLEMWQHRTRQDYGDQELIAKLNIAQDLLKKRKSIPEFMQRLREQDL
jgi:hypothetical protein